VKSLRASLLVLATVIGLIWAQGAFGQEGTTEPTTTETTTETTTDTTETTTDTTETTTTETEPAPALAPNPWAETPRTRYLRERAVWYRLVARKLSKLTRHARPTVSRTKAGFDGLLGYRLWLRDAWRTKAKRARHRAHHPPHLAGWRCIHRWEGSWTDPNSPYYGGLQMDLSFQRTYGPGLLRRKGTADHWAPYEQMWVAERAVKAGRGFYPWPLTARRCGLI
jgi:hypothetical protein